MWAGDPGAFYIDIALVGWLELKWTQARGSESIMHRGCPCEMAEAEVGPSQEVSGGSWWGRGLDRRPGAEVCADREVLRCSTHCPGESRADVNVGFLSYPGVLHTCVTLAKWLWL